MTFCHGGLFALLCFSSAVLLCPTCLGLNSYDSYEMGAPSMSTHRGLATSSGKSLVIISPSGNLLGSHEKTDGQGRTTRTTKQKRKTASERRRQEEEAS